MMDAGRHPNIELLSYSEVEKVHGYVGNFQVTVKRKPRYVDEEKCTGCGACLSACVWQDRVWSEYEAGLGLRAAAYIPFDQAVPMKAVIDPYSCLYLVKGKCSQKCMAACEADAIDFDQKEEYVNDEGKDFLKVAARGNYTKTINGKSESLTEDETIIIESVRGKWKVTEKINPWK